MKQSLELRDKSKIPVRQVLSKITLRGVKLEKDYLEVIAKTINVKDVIIETGEKGNLIVDLDTEITHELKLEGISRNLIRHINNYRKELKLSTKNRIILYIDTDSKEIIEALDTHEEKIKKLVQADVIVKNVEGKINIKKFNIDKVAIESYIELKN